MHAPLIIHIVLSVITSVVLCAAGLTALILAIQDHLLRVAPGRLYRGLPPLITMEKILFQMIIVGFVCFCALLMTSIYYFYEWFADNWWLWQKTIVAIGAWVIFAVLLMGRYYWGWRGNKAIYGTGFGVLLLAVVYFCSSLVLKGIH